MGRRCLQNAEGGLAERLVNCQLQLMKDPDNDVAAAAREVSSLWQRFGLGKRVMAGYDSGL